MIFELYIWIVSFALLYISVFWIIVSYSDSRKLSSFDDHGYPFLSIAVPTFNEEESILSTLESLLHVNYPLERFEVFVVDDASTDTSASLVRKFIKKHSSFPLHLVRHSINKGKAAALNSALKEAQGEYFAVLDADSLISPDCFKVMLPRFDTNVAAVISSISVYEPKTTVEKIQRFEYILASFMRNLMSAVDTLHTTPGVLSLYRCSLLRELGGFDEHNLTEDYEIAMRLKYHHYDVRMCEKSITYTSVPPRLKGLWRQRVRWFRGFIHNNLLYRKMFLSKKHGLMGLFQMPLNILSFVIVFLSLVLFLYEGIFFFYHFLLRLFFQGSDLLSFWKDLSLKEFLFLFNFKLHFPFLLLFLSGLYLYILAHRFSSEQWKFHFATFIYLFLYPFIRSLQWTNALLLELFGAQKKW